ncbi:MAG TPA: uroporphyrinogen decarboxylase [Parachlamydiaceae bacterium]|nr:uroporphyrinogen decarboxylase [Parachlamydiaceae bacterium]
MSLFLKALKCQNDSRPPVWLMRQAGRYMPEYRELRRKHSFLEMCHNKELIAQVTKLPIDAFGMDAAILFSDILVIPEAFGVGLSFEEHKGPIIHRPITQKKDIERLPDFKAEDSLKYVADGIKETLDDLDVPLIGFAGAPFTVASYMIEGGSSSDLKKAKQLMVQDPVSFHLLLNKIANATIDYLNMQIKAGVAAVQLFDSWANVLSFDHFMEFSAFYLKKILKGISQDVPVILFCRGSSCFASELSKLSPAGISVDWQLNIKDLRKVVPSTIALQGNLDPDILYANKDVVIKETKKILKSMQGDKGFIFNLGHGIKPDIPVASVRALVETVKSSTY